MTLNLKNIFPEGRRIKYFVFVAWSIAILFQIDSLPFSNFPMYARVIKFPYADYNLYVKHSVNNEVKIVPGYTIWPLSLLKIKYNIRDIQSPDERAKFFNDLLELARRRIKNNDDLKNRFEKFDLIGIQKNSYSKIENGKLKFSHSNTVKEISK